VIGGYPLPVLPLGSVPQAVNVRQAVTTMLHALSEALPRLAHFDDCHRTLELDQHAVTSPGAAGSGLPTGRGLCWPWTGRGVELPPDEV
jgi:hypothetical protein